jgi:hypothetical protein
LTRACFASCCVTAVLLVLAACSSAPQPSSTPMPTLRPFTSRAADTQTAAPTADPAPPSAPDSPTNTSAMALDRPKRGSSAPVGAVVFGTDFTVASRSVGLIGEKTTFPAGHPIAWRVTLPDATGGESVRVTLTTEDDTETQVDEFVAQPGWNVYYGKSLLTVAPGTYVLHYFVDGHETGSGTFQIKTADALATLTPSASPDTTPFVPYASATQSPLP